MNFIGSFFLTYQQPLNPHLVEWPKGENNFFLSTGMSGSFIYIYLRKYHFTKLEKILLQKSQNGQAALHTIRNNENCWRP